MSFSDATYPEFLEYLDAMLLPEYPGWIGHNVRSDLSWPSAAHPIIQMFAHVNAARSGRKRDRRT